MSGTPRAGTDLDCSLDATLICGEHDPLVSVQAKPSMHESIRLLDPSQVAVPILTKFPVNLPTISRCHLGESNCRICYDVGRVSCLLENLFAQVLFKVLCTRDCALCGSGISFLSYKFHIQSAGIFLSENGTGKNLG